MCARRFRAVQGLERFLAATQFCEQGAEIVMRNTVGRIDLESFAIRGLGVVETLEATQCARKCYPCPGIVRVGIDQGLRFGRGIFERARRDQAARQRQPRGPERSVLFQCLAVGVDRLGRLPQRTQEVAVIGADIGSRRRLLDTGQKQRLRLRRVTFPAADQSQQVDGVRCARIRIHDVPSQALGVVETTGAESFGRRLQASR